MSIALCGAHRVGKSTLAQAFSEKTGIQFLRSKTIEVAQQFDFDLTKPNDFTKRMDFQEALLARHIADVHTLRGPFIADRCPIDFAAYALSNLWHQTADVEDGDKRLMAYINQCLSETGKLFSGVVIVQPGIPFVVEEGKPGPSQAYQEVMHSLCHAWLQDGRVSCGGCMLRRDMLDLNDRVKTLMVVWDGIVTRQMAGREGYLH